MNEGIRILTMNVPSLYRIDLNDSSRGKSAREISRHKRNIDAM